MKIMFLGAHPDDIELGAAGLLVRLKDKNEIKLLVFSDCEEQPGNQGITKEFEKSMEALGIGKEHYRLLNIPNTKFPENAEKIRGILEEERENWKPDIIVVHSINNIHQDHKTLAEEAVRIFRNQSIIMYEDVKSTPRFQPVAFVSLTEEQLEKKIRSLECYETQKRRYYFDMEFIRALAKVRGKQMGFDFAEGFEVYRFAYR